MSHLRAFSSPDLMFEPMPSPTRNIQQAAADVGLEGISTNVKLLLKLIHDHNEASTKAHDDWKSQRVTTMMTILEDVKTRIQKSQQTSKKKELRRCNTDLKPSSNHHPPRKPSHEPPMPDDINRLRKELNASLAARKSLQMMCSSLGKEKEIMALELARKAQELNGMEELINDLRSQNEMLMEKLQACAAEHKDKKACGGGGGGGGEALQERNKELSVQLLKSLEGYRSLKRRYRDAREETEAIQEGMKDLGEEVNAGLGKIHGLKERIQRKDEEASANLEEEISALECVFQGLDTKISEHIECKRH